MPKYVAFLRAINVGGHTVRMDYLRQLFESLGLSNVETFIASGNVIFDSASKSAKALEKKIERRLKDELGYEVATFIRSAEEVAAVAAHEPFRGAGRKAEGQDLYVCFLADEPGEEATRRLLSLTSEADDFHVHGREVYWLCRKKLSGSGVSVAKLAKALGAQTTVRNTTTVKKIAEKYS